MKRPDIPSTGVIIKDGFPPFGKVFTTFLIVSAIFIIAGLGIKLQLDIVDWRCKEVLTQTKN